MTRFLSESLRAPEPYFRSSLKNLEAMHGNPSNDIKLTVSVLHQTQAKLKELGLDPVNTTSEELYHALNQRIRDDDARLIETLRSYGGSNGQDLVSGMVAALKIDAGKRPCFAIRGSRFKTLIRKIPPKKAMKQLGYRSLDSFLKHESVVAVLAAAWLIESKAWRKSLLDSYKRLAASDFESKSVSFFKPATKKWRILAENAVKQNKHNLLSFKELGALVLLPLPEADIPAGLVTVSLSLAIYELNELFTDSTYLKLNQVRPDFGEVVKGIVQTEANLNSRLLDRPVPWHLIQRYYSRLNADVRNEIFAPHIHAEDMAWRTVEESLKAIEPKLAFWHGTAHLGHMSDHKVVSLNIIDSALNVCNKIPFETRITQSFQKSLWHELLLQYLNHDTVQQTMLAQLQPEFAVDAL
jgi:hypothetical protein